MNTLRSIEAAFARRGADTYGEGVSQLEHALQCGLCAERDGATPSLIVATLLHDIGHLLHDFPDDIADTGLDTQHERLGSAWLSQHFGPEVSEPVRLHVSAKRYLATREKPYYEALSDASLLSLRLQGGLMTRDEMTAFEREPYFRESIRLRRWDDEGKIPGLEVPDLSHFASYIEGCCES